MKIWKFATLNFSGRRSFESTAFNLEIWDQRRKLIHDDSREQASHLRLLVEGGAAAMIGLTPENENLKFSTSNFPGRRSFESTTFNLEIGARAFVRILVELTLGWRCELAKAR
uniref:Uncharacterized protein n=1 Tax=Peronospora matthiolae TaxID=2874970 RepID=A0AAV1UR80_9STRA